MKRNILLKSATTIVIMFVEAISMGYLLRAIFNDSGGSEKARRGSLLKME
jgi:hypothetical protein